jgi:hypothetical protein
MTTLSTRALCCVCGLLLCASPANAQARKPAQAANPAALRALDREAERLQQEFVDSLVTLADGYEQAGDIDKAQRTLVRVLELDPKRDTIQQRLDEMKNRVFDRNEVELEIDVARGWTTSGLKLRKGEAVRVVADGSYKLIINTSVGPDGVSTEDLNRDMSSEAKLGQLMGVVFPPPQGRQAPRPGKPFAIGSEREFTPDESGMLFLRLNVPAGTKSIGTVKVKVSGNFERG